MKKFREITFEPPEGQEPVCPRCGEYFDFDESNGTWTCSSCRYMIQPNFCIVCGEEIPQHLEMCKTCQEMEDRSYRESGEYERAMEEDIVRRMEFDL